MNQLKPRHRTEKIAGTECRKCKGSVMPRGDMLQCVQCSMVVGYIDRVKPPDTMPYARNTKQFEERKAKPNTGAEKLSRKEGTKVAGKDRREQRQPVESQAVAQKLVPAQGIPAQGIPEKTVQAQAFQEKANSGEDTLGEATKKGEIVRIEEYLVLKRSRSQRIQGESVQAKERAEEADRRIEILSRSIQTCRNWMARERAK